MSACKRGEDKIHLSVVAMQASIYFYFILFLIMVHRFSQEKVQSYITFLTSVTEFSIF